MCYRNTGNFRAHRGRNAASIGSQHGKSVCMCETRTWKSIREGGSGCHCVFLNGGAIIPPSASQLSPFLDQHIRKLSSWTFLVSCIRSVSR